MRDIGRRIKRYRLSRYAPPEDRVGRRLRWAWLLAGLWLVWIGLVSDHSLWRIWRMDAENHRAQQQLAATRALSAEVERQIRDPRTSRETAEAELRRRGMARPGEMIYRDHAGMPDSLKR